MQLERGDLCPLWREKCKQLQCRWFVHMQGKHPQTGADIDDWDCAINFQVLGLLEVVRGTRGQQAATESMRNEIVSRMDAPIARGNQLDLIDAIQSQPKLIGPQ